MGAEGVEHDLQPRFRNGVEHATMAEDAPQGRVAPGEALAPTRISGVRPQWSPAKAVPVRPNPVITSSKMRRMPWRLHRSAMAGQ